MCLMEVKVKHLIYDRITLLSDHLALKKSNFIRVLSFTGDSKAYKSDWISYTRY